MRISVAGLLMAIMVPVPAGAEVKRAGASGFELESRVVVPVSPQQAFLALGQPRLWWHPDHTYSGSAANLRLRLSAGECFCEAVPADGGSIEHGHVVYSRPGAALRLHAALGPLQAEAVNGSLTWSLKQVPAGTEVTQTYVVGGFFRQDAEKLAPLIDKVMATQLSRYRDHLAKVR